MNINKGWIDTSIGILGLIVTIIASFNIIGLFKEMIQNDNLLNFINLSLGCLILIIVFFKWRNRTKFKKIQSEDFIENVVSGFKDLNNVVIYNPSKDNEKINELISDLNKNNASISIVGNAKNLVNILNQDSVEKTTEISKFIYVLNFSQDSMFVLLYNDSNTKLNIFYQNTLSSFIIKIRSNSLINEITKLFSDKNEINKKAICLENVSQPKNFLDLIYSQKKKYLTNFFNLKSGFISFYGTEVNVVQGGWLESGKFKTIRTLDLTTDPRLLLKREKYIQINKNYIKKQNGIIKRVYLIHKDNLKDNTFAKNLKLAINLQKEIGVMIGLQFLEDLTPEEKQDFILYDMFTVLVEEKQANLDYSFGKSSAYFLKEKVMYYENIFENVWNGLSTGVNAIDQLNRVLKKIK